jgi:primosomal protein N' (replication factor Y)
LGRRVLTAVVVKVMEQLPRDIPGLKSVVKVLDDAPALSRELLELGKWISEYYYCSWGEALSAMLPVLMKPVVRETIRRGDRAPDKPLKGLALELWERLAQGPLSRPHLLKGLPSAGRTALNRLQETGLIVIQTRMPKTRQRAEKAVEAFTPEKILVMTPQQAEVLVQVQQALDQKNYHALLLHGVTGSGKTEVYLQAIAYALEQGRGAIMLVPEIALTPQACSRITARFGPLVSVLHSGLAPAERARSWARLRSGEARVALGARSAIFAPVHDLGLIVVDEEPEGSYKQEDAPRYHARDVAAVRAKSGKAVLLMGSATPSIESYQNALQGRYQLLNLPERVDGKMLPEIRLVDMGEELRQRGRYALFSDVLVEELEKRLRLKEQSILFLNRRGFAPVVMCPACRHVVSCPDCSVPLVYHQTDDCLRCHSCGRKASARPACPQCGTACSRLSGAGTQRVEEELKRLLPAARVIRIDQDTSRKRGFLVQAFDQFGRQEADILVGTQMVAKGIDFPNVTLVGIVSADTGLHLPYFRAEERTFQLVVLVAGRGGRGGRPGLVLAQTLNAGHAVMTLAKQQDFKEFFKREIEQRRDLHYPPFSRIANVVCRSLQADAALKMAEKVVSCLKQGAGPADLILGPAPSPHEKVAGQVRFQVLVKSRSVADRSRLLRRLDQLTELPGTKLAVDIDPMNLL